MYRKLFSKKVTGKIVWESPYTYTVFDGQQAIIVKKSRKAPYVIGTYYEPA